MEYSLNELKKKQVINVTDGKKLGKITDVEISFPCSKVISYTVGGIGLFCTDPIKITPCEIQCVGEDAILVKLSTNESVKEERMEE